MIQAFLFDMDGTLLDSEILWVEAVRRVLEDAGCPTTPGEALHIAYGHAWDHVYERFRRHSERRSWTNEEIAAAVDVQFNEVRAERDIRIPGSIALLRQLAERYPAGIVSGSYRRDIARGIEYMGIADCVSFYVGGEDVATGKPHPACYLLAADLLGLPPGECLVFEDSTAGVRAAKDAGMHCVAFARPGRPAQDYRGADLVLADLSEFDIARYETQP